MEKAIDVAARAIPDFLNFARILSGREGDMLPEDSFEMWKTDHPKMAAIAYSEPGKARQDETDLDRKTKVARDAYKTHMSQAQWLMLRVAEDAVVGIERLFERELF